MNGTGTVGGWTAYIERDRLRRDTLELYLWRSREDGTNAIVQVVGPGVFDLVEVPEREPAPGPTMTLTLPQVRALAVALHEAGAMPDDGAAALRGRLEATENHLADLRAVLLRTIDPAWQRGTEREP